jgi:hypothetical protein
VREGFQFWPHLSLAGENGIPTELGFSLNHPKQIIENIFDGRFGVSIPLNLRHQR